MNSADNQKKMATLVLLLTAVLFSHGQKISVTPGNGFFPEFHISPAEIFFDTKTLPDGHQVEAFLFKNEVQSYFFPIEDDNTPISITVIPCISTIEWKVFLTDIPTEHSGNGPVSDNQVTMHGKITDKIENESGGKVPIQSFRSDEAMTFHGNDGRSGVYMIEIKVTDRDSSVKLFATTFPLTASSPFPKLPTNDKIEVKPVVHHRVELQWNPSPTNKIHGHPVDYCVSFNKKANFKTMCEAEINVLGETPPTIPPNAGFGFSKEKDIKTRLSKHTNLIPVANRNDAQFICTGGKTKHNFHGLKPGNTYFFDVFVVNKLNNLSSKYEGNRILMKKFHQKVRTLYEDKVVTDNIRKSKHKAYKYTLSHYTKSLTFAIHSCHSVFVEIKYKGRLVKRTRVKHDKLVKVKNPRVGEYRLVVGSRKERVPIKLVVNTKPKHMRFPLVPADVSLKTSKRFGKRCTNVKIKWKITNKRQRYCLYKRKHVQKGKNNTILTPCTVRPQKWGEKVMCKYIRARKNQSTASYTIRNIKNDVLYVFNIFVSTPGGETLAYQPRQVKTKSSNC